MFKVGDVVRYDKDWATKEELKYIHVVVETGLISPVTGNETRLKIQTLNTKLTFAPVEVVEEYMVNLVEQEG